MNIKKNITINISKYELQQIIADYIQKETEFNVRPEDVEFSIRTICVGYGKGEREESVFTGCTVRCNGE